MVSKKIILFIGIFVGILIFGSVYAFIGGGNTQKGLVLHLPLDEEHYNSNTERVTDVSAFENHGTNVGASLASDRMGQSNGAMSFDGTTSSYIQVDDSSSLDITDEITMMMWLNPESFNHADGNNYPTPIAKSSQNYRWFIQTNGIISERFSGFSDLTTNTSLQTGEWTHVALTYNGTGFTWYINGEFDAGDSQVGSITTNNDRLVIGNWDEAGERAYKGNISDVRIYNYALTETEIQTLYDAYKPKVSAGSLQKGLVGHWMLDSEGYNSNTERITDKSAYENHGTNSGASLTTDQNGQSDEAMEFNQSDYVNVGSDSSINGISDAVTVAGWIYPGESYSYNYIFSNDRDCCGSYKGYSLRFAGSGPQFKIWDSSSSAHDVTGSSYSMANWYHLAGTYDGTTQRLYVNGVEDGTPLSWSGSIGTPASYAGTLGALASHKGSLGLKGNISDVRIYNRALSAEEIAILAKSYRPKVSAGSLQKGLLLDLPLTSKYLKDETAGSEIFTDRTPYSLDSQNYGASVGEDSSYFVSSDWVQIDGNVGVSGAMSIDFWFNTPNKNANQYFFDNRDPGSWWFIKNYTGGTCGSYSGNICFEGRVYAQDSDWNVNEWTHIAVTDDTSTAKMYINGELVNSGTGESTSITTNLRIGTRYTNSGYFQGNISKVHVYNRALSADEVKLLYDKGRNM